MLVDPAALTDWYGRNCSLKWNNDFDPGMPVIGLTEFLPLLGDSKIWSEKRRFSENGFDFSPDDADRSEFHDASTGYSRHCCFIPNLWRKPYGCVVAFLSPPTNGGLHRLACMAHRSGPLLFWPGQTISCFGAIFRKMR